MDALTAADPRAIGEFRLRARLGAGGMGQVFLATSLAGRMVAVKVIHQNLGRDPEFIRRFRGEVNAAARVSAIYTAPVVAAGVDDMPPWLATAFVPGPSLDDIVARHGPLPVPALWRLAGGLAEALRAIHATGLVHRDLKPANVLLATDGPRVIDFGIARALTESRLTATGSVIGTPGFMSPEQVEGLECGPPSDVFSLGSVLAFAACGTTPFNGGPGRSSASVMYRVVHTEPDLAGVPEATRELIAACLAKDPGLRPDLGQVAGHCAAMADYLGLSAAAFWPSDVAQVIAAKQAALATELQELQAAPVAPAHWPGAGMSQPGAWLEAPGMGTSPSRHAVVPPVTGPSRAGWEGAPFPGMALDGRTAGTPRPGVSRRGLFIGAGAAGAAVIGGVGWWALASRSPRTPTAGYERPTTGAPGTGARTGTGAPAGSGDGASHLAWAFTTGNGVLANPGAANGVVYFGCRDNYVYAVDIATGKQVWKCQVGWVTAAPALVGGMVCVATTLGKFYAIHAASGLVAWQQQVTAGAYKQPWAIDGGDVILPLSVVQPLQAFDAATGLKGKSYGSGGQYSGTLAAADGVLYAFDGFGALHAVTISTGASVWNSQVVGSGDTPGTGLVISGGAIYVGTVSGTLYSLNAATGHANWSYQTGNTLIANPAVGEGLVYVNDSSGNLYAIKAADGKRAWTGPAGTGGGGGPAVAGGRVYVSTGLALQALDAKSGAAIWSFSPPAIGGLVSTPAVAGGLVFVGSSSDNLYAVKA